MTFQIDNIQKTMTSFNLSEIPCWYLTVSFILCCYYSWRGARANYLFNVKRIETDNNYPINKRQAFWIYSLHDAVFHMICSLSGFLTLYILCSNYQTMGSNETSAGDSILFIFLSLYSILGITGMLPQLIQQGKLPGMK